MAAGADYLIAIGGGSSMDTAKGIGIVIANPGIRGCEKPGGDGAHEE